MPEDIKNIDSDYEKECMISDEDEDIMKNILPINSHEKKKISTLD